MYNFLVGLTNIRPSSSTFMNYSLCGQWPGDALGGQTMFLRCLENSTKEAFQYVILRGMVEYLNFCELEVYAAGE